MNVEHSVLAQHRITALPPGTNVNTAVTLSTEHSVVAVKWCRVTLFHMIHIVN